MMLSTSGRVSLSFENPSSLLPFVIPLSLPCSEFCVWRSPIYRIGDNTRRCWTYGSFFQEEEDVYIKRKISLLYLASSWCCFCGHRRPTSPFSSSSDYYLQLPWNKEERWKLFGRKKPSMFLLPCCFLLFSLRFTISPCNGLCFKGLSYWLHKGNNWNAGKQEQQ